MKRADKPRSISPASRPMRRNREVIAAGLCGLAMLLVAGCGGSSSSGGTGSTHTVVDSTGVSVKVPSVVNRIADSWPAHNEVVQMLGGGSKIVATVLTPSAVPWLYTVDPALAKAQTVFTDTTEDTDRLVEARPDVLFNDVGTQDQTKTTSLGIPTLQLGFQTFNDLKKVVNTTADVLGPSAKVLAQRYDAYLDSKLASVTAVTSKIPLAKQPTVLHIYSLDPLVVDGTGSIIDAWIKAAGGRDAAQVSGNAVPVSKEQVARWNPDVIDLASSAFVGNDTGQQTLAKLTKDPFGSQLKAVRDHHAYINPTGGWHWDRYGIEEALQIQWAAKTLHPTDFAGLDLVAATKSFYEEFLHYKLTDDQATRIIDGENPA
jgi:iron complex transport system substrate-binding protein